MYEIDVTRSLLDEEIVAAQVIEGLATASAPAGTSDPVLVTAQAQERVAGYTANSTSASPRTRSAAENRLLERTTRRAEVC